MMKFALKFIDILTLKSNVFRKDGHVKPKWKAAAD